MPSCFRYVVLLLDALDACGHLGIKKTSDHVLRFFFWPCLKRDVAKYVKLCHVCQFAGKPCQLGVSPNCALAHTDPGATGEVSSDTPCCGHTEWKWEGTGRKLFASVTHRTELIELIRRF